MGSFPLVPGLCLLPPQVCVPKTFPPALTLQRDVFALSPHGTPLKPPSLPFAPLLLPSSGIPTPQGIHTPFSSRIPSTCSQLLLLLQKADPLSLLALENASSFCLSEGQAPLPDPGERTTLHLSPVGCTGPSCLPPSNRHFSFLPPTDQQPGPISREIYNFLLWWPTEYTPQLPVPLPNGSHKAPSGTLRMQTPPQRSPQVSNRPLVLPYGRRLPFLALQNVGVRDRAPHNTASPCPRNTPPRSIRWRTRLAAIPGVHGRLPGSPAPHPPQAGSGRPLPRGRLRGAHSDVPGSRGPAARPARPFGRPAGPAGRGPSPAPPARAPRATFLLSRTIRSSLGSS